MTERDQNRKNMPLVAAFVDEMRKQFDGDLKVIWAMENGNTAGHVPQWAMK